MRHNAIAWSLIQRSINNHFRYANFNHTYIFFIILTLIAEEHDCLYIDRYINNN